MLVFLLQILINRELRQRWVYLTVVLMAVFLTGTYMLYDDYSDIATFIVNLGLLAFVRDKKFFIVTSLTATLAYILFSFFGADVYTCITCLIPTWASLTTAQWW